MRCRSRRQSRARGARSQNYSPDDEARRRSKSDVDTFHFRVIVQF